MRANLRLVHDSVKTGCKSDLTSISVQKAYCRAVPLTQELLTLAAISERESADLNLPHLLGLALQPDMSYAFLDGGLLVGALGVIPMFPGRAAGWMLISGLARPRHLAVMTRHGRALIDRLAQNPAFRRIEIHIRHDRPWRESFAARLGMNEALGPMQYWDPLGRAYWQYARVTP